MALMYQRKAIFLRLVSDPLMGCYSDLETVGLMQVLDKPCS